MPQALQQQLITLPITMPGAKPGDAQQTVQIQVVNPNAMQQAASNSQHIQHLQNFQQGTTVLTVAYAPQDGDFLQNHGLPEVALTFYLEELQVLNGDILYFPGNDSSSCYSTTGSALVSPSTIRVLATIPEQ